MHKWYQSANLTGKITSKLKGIEKNSKKLLSLYLKKTKLYLPKKEYLVVKTLPFFVRVCMAIMYVTIANWKAQHSANI